jgi:hypothetical protein
MSQQQSHHHHHHHHHSHKKDFATLFKEHNLRTIRINRLVDKWLKRLLLLVAIGMAIAVVYVYKIA